MFRCNHACRPDFLPLKGATRKFGIRPKKRPKGPQTQPTCGDPRIMGYRRRANADPRQVHSRVGSVRSRPKTA